MSKEKGIPQNPTYQPKNSLIENEIIEKIKVAIDNGTKQTIVHNTVPHVFSLIEMNIDDLYYNLENDRTLTKTREFIEDNLGYPDSYFDHENTTSLEAQQDYHNIIFDFIPTKMPIILDKYRNQRDPIYITESGIIANGNTRVACFRELLNKDSKESFRTIKCLVIPGENWKWIRELVDQTDNIPDFSSRYPWYARAERMERDFKHQYDIENPLAEPNDGGASSIQWREISNSKEYPNPANAKRHLIMLNLAREFVSQGFDDFKRLSDLDKIGNESALQAFDTLEKAYSKADEAIAKEYLKFESFAHIASKNTGLFGNTHRILQQIWSSTNIDVVSEKFSRSQADNMPDILAGERVDDSFEKSKNLEINRYKDKTNFESKIDDELGILWSQKQVKVETNKRSKYRSSLDQALNILKHTYEHNLNDKTDLSGAQERLDSLNHLIAQMQSKVNSLSDLENE